MKEVKYVGQENGLYISKCPIGQHFLKGVVTEVEDAVYDGLLEMYPHEFEFKGLKPKETINTVEPLDDGIPDQMFAEKLGLDKEVEEEKKEDEHKEESGESKKKGTKG